MISAVDVSLDPGILRALANCRVYSTRPLTPRETYHLVQWSHRNNSPFVVLVERPIKRKLGPNTYWRRKDQTWQLVRDYVAPVDPDLISRWREPSKSDIAPDPRFDRVGGTTLMDILLRYFHHAIVFPVGMRSPIASLKKHSV